MLGYNVAMEIDEQVSLWTLHPFSLVSSVQGATVDASVELVVFFFEEKFKFFHEKCAGEFIFFILKIIQLIE